MTKNSTPKRPEKADGDFDLVASGSSGEWRVFVDETHVGPEKWFAQIQGPSIYLSFAIPSAKMIDRLVHFLAECSELHPSSRSRKSNNTLLIGGDKRMPVTLIRDNEYADRFFLMVGTGNGPVVRYVVAGKELVKLIAALRQARDELKSDGLLL
jgi:hypothetical protein